MKRGFTLVEVLMALVIIGVMATLAYPSYAAYITKTRRIQAQMAMLETIQKEESYYSQHNTYLAFSSAEPQPGFQWWVGGLPSNSAYEIEAQACPGREIGQCVQVRAIPGSSKVDASFRDPDCAVLTFSSSGERTASGTSDRCWP